MRALLLTGALLSSALAWSGDCRDVWRQIQRNQPAPFAEAGCNLDFYDRYGRSPLIAALDAKVDPALVRHLLDAGAKPNFPSRYGNPPLIWAITAGPAMTRLLLARGAAPLPTLNFSGPLFSGFDVTHKFAGRVPTLYLGAWLQAGASQMLHAGGVRLDPSDSARLVDEMTTLPAAELEILLQSGFNLAARNSRGQTLLHEVVRLQKRALIPVLLRYGASAQDRDAAGFTVLDLARQLKRPLEMDCLQGRVCR